MSNNGKGLENACNNSSNDSNCVNPLAECFFSLPPKQFSLLATFVGILLVDNLDLNRQNALGNFIVSVGQAILTAAAQGQSLQSNNSQNDHIRQQIQMLKRQICTLEKELEDQN